MKKYAKAVEWFESINRDFDIEKRTDQYIAVQSIEVGIKIRGQTKQQKQNLPKLELKWRKKKYPDFYIIDEIAGVAEEWIKWIWEIKEVETTQTSANLFSKVDNDSLLAFKKERHVRRYKINNGSGIVAAKRIPAGDNGIMNEITCISFDKYKWWSLGIEAFKTKTNLSVFKNLSRQVLADCPIVLDEAQSFGYPMWIMSQVMRYRNL